MAKISLAGFKDPVRRPRYILWAGAAVLVLAAFIAVYDADGTIRRVRGQGLTLDVTQSTTPAKASTPGSDAAKWLIDDDLLISAALGLL